MLKNNGLLTPLQQEFLAIFSRIPDQARFYLTGDTALSEFYLGHRLSFDLDLFTSDQELILPTSYQIEELCAASGLQIAVIRRFASYVEFVISRVGESLKVDLALDSSFRFAPAVDSESGVLVNDLQDLQFDLYWFAIALNRAERFPDEIDRWPVKMLRSVNALDLKRLFLALARKIMEKLTTTGSSL
jgi:hypothetical protein